MALERALSFGGFYPILPAVEEDEPWRKRRAAMGAAQAHIAFDLAEADEVKKKRGRPRRSSVASERLGAPSAASVPSAGRQARVAQGRLQEPAARSQGAVKRGLASGSQSAVVKLASFASGKARLTTLGKYLQQNGQVQLEREDGSVLSEGSTLEDLAARWAEQATKREPSKDVILMQFSVAPETDSATVAEGLNLALRGHRYAWRMEETEEGPAVHVVMTAASSEKNENGRSERVFDSQKSLDRLEQRLADRFGEEVSLDIKAWAHGVDGAARHLTRLTKGGQREAQLDDGKVLNGHAANLELAKSWKRPMRSQEQRDVAHVILSAKPGTPREAFFEAARATLQRVFKGHDYVFGLHENRNHLHVHAMIRMEDRDGHKMHPNIRDFQTWRQVMAQEARQRHIQMEAPSRFESANAPGYKLKDIRRYERGAASESVRRRVDAVLTRAVHVPTRLEGLEKARAVAGQWRSLTQENSVARSLRAGELQVDKEAPILADHVRLYRFERDGVPRSSAPLYSTERRVAENFEGRGTGKLLYIDVPRESLSDLKASRQHPSRDYVLPVSIHRQARPLREADIARFQQRTETAVALAEKVEESEFKNYILRDKAQEADAIQAAKLASKVNKDIAMPNSENMVFYREDFFKNLDELASLVPEAGRARVTEMANGIKDKWDEGIEVLKQREQRLGIVEGDKYVEPRPKAFDDFIASVPVEAGEPVRYSTKPPDESEGAVAFTDNGKRITVEIWEDRAAMIAALQLGSDKWGEITVSGPEKYQNTVAEIAAEYGFKISNPELQEQLQQARVRQRSTAQAERPTVDGVMQRQTLAPEQGDRVQVPSAPEVPDAAQAATGRIEGERQAALNLIREEVDGEAEREVRQARVAHQRHESPADPGYRSDAEAHSAKIAEQAVDSNPRQSIPQTPETSPEIRRLAERQEAIKEEGEEAEQQKPTGQKM